MKTAIATIMDGANYGNRLQNYALQTVLNTLGAEAYTLNMKTSNDLSIPEEAVYILKNQVKRLLGREYSVLSKSYKLRKQKFSEFNRRYIQLAEETLEFNRYPKSLSDRYAFFIAGSDQVWNCRTKIIAENINNYLLQFAPKSKRIAYAASFGTKDVVKEFANLFAQELGNFHAISVRETEGSSIVKQLCGRKAEVVLDPTMLLTTAQWNEIAVKPRFLTDEKFILTYFLGGRSAQMREYIQSVADSLGCCVVNLENDYIPEYAIENTSHYLATPDEFLWLVANAECMLTDSFHGCVFSILYGTPFHVFNRVNVEAGNVMSGRLDTLLSLFHLQDRQKSLNEPTGIPEPFCQSRVDAILRERRSQSIAFLQSALEEK